MARLCPILVVLVLAFAAVPAAAQDAAKPSSMAGNVMTKKKLTECKRQAKEQKLRFAKRQKFVRDCAKG